MAWQKGHLFLKRSLEKESESPIEFCHTRSGAPSSNPTPNPKVKERVMSQLLAMGGRKVSLVVLRMGHPDGVQYWIPQRWRVMSICICCRLKNKYSWHWQFMAFLNCAERRMSRAMLHVREVTLQKRLLACPRGKAL